MSVRTGSLLAAVASLVAVVDGTAATAQIVTPPAPSLDTVRFRLTAAKPCADADGTDEIVVCGSRERDHRLDRSLMIQTPTEVRHRDGRRAWEDEPRCSVVGGRVCPGTGEFPISAIAAKVVQTAIRLIRGE